MQTTEPKGDTMIGTKTNEWYTLEQFDKDHLSYASTTEDGTEMRFDSFDEAAEMATFIVEDPSEFPLVGILANEIEEDGEHTGWSAGWVQREKDGKATTHEGDYENDADVWKVDRS